MIGMNEDDPLDPKARESLIAGIAGGRRPSGIGAAFGTAVARPPLGPASRARFEAGATAPLDARGQSMADALGGPAPTSPMGVPGGDAGIAPRPVDPASLQTLGSVGDVFHNSYSAGSNVNNSGKNKFGRFKGALGHDPSDDEIRQFVAANPGEWEDSTSPGGEYVFRQKQGFLNDPTNLDSKTGATTIWQNRNFVNAAGSGDGYAPPYEEHQAELPGGSGSQFGLLDPRLQGNAQGGIQDALSAVQSPSTIQDLIKRLQQGA